MQGEEESARAEGTDAEGTGTNTIDDDFTGANTVNDDGIGECDVEDYDIIAPQENIGEVNEEDINEQVVDDEGDLDLDQPSSKSEHIQLINKDERTTMLGDSIEDNMTANRDESMEIDS